MNRTLKSLAVAVTAVLATAGAASAHDEPGGPAHTMPKGARAQLAQLKHDYAKYKNPAFALADGWIPTATCVQLPDGSAGMGYHFVNPALISAPPDPKHPAILVYVPGKGDKITLGAVEWFQPDADQDLSTDSDRPSVMGIPFDGPMPGHEEGMPIHYDLHAWLFKHNRDGLLDPWNPAVHCPAS